MKWWDKFNDWLYEGSFEQKVDDIIQGEKDFMATLDDRQKAYYISLTETLHRDVVALETRVYNLENK